MEIKIYIDGKWLRKKDAKISVFDHGLLYGDGVFEGIRAYDGHVFRLRAHLNRLYRSARLISLTIPVPLPKLEAVVKEAVVRNRFKDCYIRLLVTRGAGDLGLDPRACPTPSIIVIADKLALFPARCYTEGLETVFAKTRRTPAESFDPTIKSMNYLNNILAKIEANHHGVPEAILCNAQGNIAECTGDNVFYVKGNAIVTPPVSAGALEGITRGVVMEIVKAQTRFRIQEKLFTPAELLAADEVFFTGTAAEVIPVAKINHRRVGKGKPGPVTQKLMGLFKELTKDEARRRAL